MLMMTTYQQIRIAHDFDHDLHHHHHHHSHQQWQSIIKRVTAAAEKAEEAAWEEGFQFQTQIRQSTSGNPTTSSHNKTFEKTPLALAVESD